jgi:hypothetical protein
MDGTCGMHGGEENVYTGFGLGNMKNRDHLGDVGVDRMLILKWILKK